MSVQNIKQLFSERVKLSTKIIEEDEPVFVNENNDVNNKPTFLSLKESDVGITEYLTDCKGFDAVIKQRYSDFHVHEIDTDENIVYLTNTDIPKVKEKIINLDVIPAETWDKLDKVFNKQLESLVIDVTDYTKEKRKNIHQAIKSKYGLLLKSNTITADNKKNLVVSLGKDPKTSPWFLELGAYLHFVLFKQNLDTSQAINILAKYLKTKPSNLTYAGNKDKRAVTSQWVSMWHLDANRLKGLNNKLGNISVGNFKYTNSPLKLGNLKGNFFEIALRNVKENNDLIEKALNTIKENGFINYFGLQRFGNSIEIPTYEIGKALVKADFKTAVELILKPRNCKVTDDLKEARKIWWETRDAKKAYQTIKSKDKTIEGKLLLGLAKHGKNAYVNALDSIPRNIRLLYLHSFQSFLWNKVISKRINKFGQNVLEGDLVLIDNNQEINESSESNTDENVSASKTSVKFLLKDEIQKYQITDIVYPLPGYNVSYPNNIIKVWYEELLKEYELTSENFNQVVKKYAMSGAYRHIVKSIKNLTWNTCYYSEPEQDLILSDVDKLNNKLLTTSENSEGNFKAIILRFSLDSSTYATMALREILKIDTSNSHQASLNSYSNNKRILESTEDKTEKKIKFSED